MWPNFIKIEWFSLKWSDKQTQSEKELSRLPVVFSKTVSHICYHCIPIRLKWHEPHADDDNGDDDHDENYDDIDLTTTKQRDDYDDHCDNDNDDDLEWLYM